MAARRARSSSGGHDERGAAPAIRPLEPIDDRAVVPQGQPAQAQRGAQQVSDQALERGPVARRGDDPGVDVDAADAGDKGRGGFS